MRTKKMPTMLGHAFIAVDVSGSARYADIARGVKQAESVVRALGARQASYLAFDHRIECEKKAKLGAFGGVKILMKSGGGGTDYRPLFNRLAECPETSLMVVVTDMLGAIPDKNPVQRATVIWLNTDESDSMRKVPSFGLCLAPSVVHATETIRA